MLLKNRRNLPLKYIHRLWEKYVISPFHKSEKYVEMSQTISPQKRNPSFNQFTSETHQHSGVLAATVGKISTARGLFKETSASQSLHKQNLPYLGSPQHVQHIPSCSVFVRHGHRQVRQHRCWLWALSHQTKDLSGACSPGVYPNKTGLTAWLPQQPLYSLGCVHHSAFTTHSS